MKFKLALIVLTCTLLARAEEVPAPWMLQPLRPPSRLVISNLSILLDYQQRSTPGTVPLVAEADLANQTGLAVDEQFMLINGDAGSVVTWEGKVLSQDRLVTEVPNTPGKAMARVSVFHLIVLPNEKGHLKFTGLHRLDFSSGSAHQSRLLFPLRRAWHGVGESQVTVRLVPELRMLSKGFKPVPGQNDTYSHHFGAYSKAFNVSLEAKVDGPRWAGALGTVPALRRAWLWGGLAALLSVTLISFSRRFWWLAIPLSLTFNLGLRRADPTVNQWTYYEDAPRYKRVLELEWYLIPLWAFLGGLGVAVLGQTKETK
ncbi:hypothetical protein JST97_09980 [bacterium]|nr:hypothetical protein [bacterium]